MSPLAETIDAPAVCVATGRPLPGNPSEQAREYLLDSRDEITDYPESAGVEVGIEFEPELLVERTDEVLELIDDAGSNALGVNLDIGHAECTAKTRPRASGNMLGILPAFTSGISPVDVGGNHYHLIPGEGDLDFEGVLKRWTTSATTGSRRWNCIRTLMLLTKRPLKPIHSLRNTFAELFG